MIMSGFALNIILVHNFPNEDVGVFYILLSIIVIASGIGQFGLNHVILRFTGHEVANDTPEHLKHVLLLIFGIACLTVLLSSIGIVLCNEFIFSNLFEIQGISDIKFWIGLIVFTTATLALLAEFFRGLHDYLKASLFSGALDKFMLMISVLLLLGLNMLLNITDIIGVLIIITSLEILAALVIINQYLKSMKFVKSERTIKDVVHIAIPLFFMSLVSLLFLNIDLWMVGIIDELAMAGIYASVKRLLLMVLFPLAIVNQIMLPIIVDLHTKKQSKKLELVLRSSASLVFIISLLATIILVIFAGPILTIIFGDGFSSGIALLNILAIGYLINAWTGSCGLTLIYTGHQTSALWANLAGISLFVFLCLLFKNIMQVTHIAAFYCICMILQNITMMILVWHHEKIWTYAGNPVFLYKNMKNLLSGSI